MTLTADLEHARHVRALIEDLLADPRQLGPDYQPIVRLADDTVVGYKATGRGRPGTELADTLALLAGAQSLGLVERLDWAFRALAFEDFLGRPGVELHLTPEPETFGTLCPPRHAALFARARRELAVAAEVHLDAFDDRPRLDRGLDELRAWGWRVVLADVADDPTALATVPELRPDVIQVDLALPGRAGATSPAVRAVAAAAREVGAELMAVGVDSPSARRTAEEIGCRVARGALFGRPGDLPATGPG